MQKLRQFHQSRDNIVQLVRVVQGMPLSLRALYVGVKEEG